MVVGETPIAHPPLKESRFNMLRRTLLVLPLLLGAPSLAFAGHRPPPPSPKVEHVVARPGHAWVKGHWTWRGHWVWVAGYHKAVAPAPPPVAAPVPGFTVVVKL